MMSFRFHRNYLVQTSRCPRNSRPPRPMTLMMRTASYLHPFCRIGIWLLCSALHLGAYASTEGQRDSQPNIVFVFADDLGYGEIQALNPERGKIPTPAADTLASQGESRGSNVENLHY